MDKVAYIVLGMKRSGHHAIIYWIAHNSPNASLLYNDCIHGWNMGQLIPNENQQEKSKIIKVGTGDVSNHIYNIENFEFDDLKDYDFRKFKCFKDFKAVYILSVIRDPYNWMASYYKMGGLNQEKVLFWIQQANFHLNGKDGTYKDVILASYNDWFSSEENRKMLSKMLHLQSHNNKMNELSPRGYGSSFDKLKFKHKATEMKVLDRWEVYKDDCEYAKLFHPYIHIVSKQLFNLDKSAEIGK